MKNYTLVLYKSDGCNTCRGCVMEQWGSEFDFYPDIDENDVVVKIVDAFTRRSDGGSYSAHLIGVLEETNDQYDHGMLTPTEKVIYQFEQYNGSSWQNEVGGVNVLSYHCSENEEKVEKIGIHINKLIRDKVEKLLENRRIEVEMTEAAELEKKVKEQEVYERQQLLALQKKYENK
jgi:hypothetical protein